MTDINKKLKKYEKRLEKVIEDPEKLIKIVDKIIDLVSTDDGKRIVTPPVRDDQKVEFWQFVKYFGNMHVENSLPDKETQAKAKRWVTGFEEEIRRIDGFSSYDLPEGLVIKYR